MKPVFVLILAACLPCAAQRFATGQAARAMIGQRTFTDQQPGADCDVDGNCKPSASLVGGVSGLAYFNDTLYVADSNRIGAAPQNNRILIFRNVSATIPRPGDELFFTRDCPVCTGAADLVVGQADFTSKDFSLKQNTLRTPTSVATDGTRLVVADTDNNRILIWNTIPQVNGAPADVVVGQPNFTTSSIPPNNTPTAQSLRGPQGVWIVNGRLFVADTQNHRVLIWNSIPTTHQKAADVVLGQPNFTTFVEPDIGQAAVNAKANNMLNPVSVTSDGVRLFVSDLGHNRVLVWNSIPTANQAPADFAIGQPDLESAISNNSEKLCPSNGTDTAGKATYPARCEATISFPRFALSDGSRLFIADGGNDRVVVFNRIPTRSGENADVIIGQLAGGINQASDATDSMRTPMSLAWDGTNLFVSDSYNRRITIYSPGEPRIPYSGVRNAASREIYAVGNITLSGAPAENEELTITIGTTDANKKDYKYKTVKDDTLGNIIRKVIDLINADTGDPWAFASGNPIADGIILTARTPGSDGNIVNYSVAVAGPDANTAAKLVASTTGAQLTGGQDAAQIAPGSIVSLVGDGLAEVSAAAPDDADPLPTTLGNVQVYFDGIRAPLFFVSPGQINAQLPFEVRDRTSVNAWVRTVLSDGSVRVTTPVAVTIVTANPGIFAGDGPDPRPAVLLHGSAFATGTVSVDGSIKAADTATVTIEDRAYTVTIVAEDTKNTVRDKLVELINANSDERVRAVATPTFQRIRLFAKEKGEAGLGIKYAASASTDAQIVMTAFGSELCCANEGLVTEANPAIPGETLLLYATGVGLGQPRTEVTGEKYKGEVMDPIEFMNSLAGAKTANIFQSSFKPGTVGLYEVILELNSDLPTNPLTQLTIAQGYYVSNIVTFPVNNPKPPE